MGNSLLRRKLVSQLTIGVMCVTFALASLVSGQASANDAPAEKPGKPSNDLAADKPLPELIGITWQQIPQSNTRRIQQPVWRPDGTLLPEAEVNSLLEQLEGFQSHWWNTKEDLRPLVFLFRANRDFRDGIMTGILMPDDKPYWCGSWRNLNAEGFTKSSASPNRSRLAKWPAKIDLQIKVPIEAPTLIKTIDSITDERIEVGPGVRWYIDKKRGVDESQSPPRSGLTAAILETRNDHLEKLTHYYSRVWIKGREQPLSEWGVTVIEPEPDVRASIRISRAIDDPKSIEKVEFHRQRFRMERIKHVDTRLDLLPEEIAQPEQQ